MKKIIVLASLLLLCTMAKAQNKASTDGHTYLYRVQLADKKGTRYSLRKPEKFLSEKALKRRERQHLGVDSTDLPLSKKYIDQLNEAGYQVVGGSKWNNTALVKLDDTLRAEGIKALPFVKGVKLVFRSPKEISPVKVSELKVDSVKPNAEEPYGVAKAQIKQLNGIRLHEAGYRGKGMLIAVIDGGYMNADIIPMFEGVKIVDTRDFFYPYNANPYQLLSHGTMVLSCMATNQKGRYIGTAPEAEYALLRSEYGYSESLAEEDSWAMAAEYADSIGADVINSSLGYALFDDKSTNFRYADLDGERTLISHTASMLAQKGMLLVCSAGNSGNDTWKKITPPGDARNVLTVGAIDRNGMNKKFSSVGPSQDGRVKPDVMALGGGTEVVEPNGLISRASGTSFASPVCCGMVACLWQALPEKTATEIIELVRASADRYSEPDNIFGYGVPDFWKAYQEGKSEK